MLLDTISSLYQKHRKNIFFIWCFVTLFFAFWDSVFAEPPGDRAWWSEILDEDTAKKIAKALNFLLAGAAMILSMITSFITMFLYPGWVNGSLFGLQAYFKDIWILISNIVYFMFAGVLIIIAFMNIIGKGEWNWELRQALPKFIVGVLIVPFSWFFVQFVLSITSILTVWVLTLPYDTFKDRPELAEVLSEDVKSQKFCKDFIIDLKWNGWGRELSSLNPSWGWGWWGIEFPETLKCAEGDEAVTSFEEMLTWNGKDGISNSVFWIINIYTYGILQIDKLDTISTENITWAIKDVSDLLFKIIFDALFVIVYLLLMVALFLALFARIVRLWIYMMLSPAFWLLYFFWSDGVGDGSNKFSVKEFIALALVPVYVSAALAFGLVFILVAGAGIDKGQGTSKNTLEAWGFSITILWAFAEDSEKSVIWKLIVKIFWLVILWIAVMAALRSSETTRAVVEPIAAFWKSVWELAAKAPTYAPIIPTWSGWMQSAQSLQRLWWNFTAAVQNTSTDRAKDFMDWYGIWWEASKLTAEAKKIATNIERLSLWDGKREVWSEFKKLFQQGIKVDVMAGNEDSKRVLMSTAKHMWIEDEVKKLNIGTPQWFANAVALIDFKWKQLAYGDIIPNHNDGTKNSLTYQDLNKLIESWWSGTTWSPKAGTSSTATININKLWEYTEAWNLKDSVDASDVAKYVVRSNDKDWIISEPDFRSRIDWEILDDWVINEIVEKIKKERKDFFSDDSWDVSTETDAW